MKRLVVLCVAMTACAAMAVHPSLPVLMGLATQSVDEAFVSTWRTTTSSETITVPTRSGYSYSYECEVDWGDGTVETLSGYDDAKWVHTYATADDYTVRIRGTFESIYFNNGGDKLKLLGVQSFGDVGWATLDRAFYGCANAAEFSGSIEGAITSLYQTWYGCSSATSFPDVSALTSVSSLYQTWRNCSSATSFPDVSALTSVTTLYRTWYDCSSCTTVPALPTSSTALTITTSAMQFIGSGMTGTVVELWNTTNFPNVTVYEDTFTGATGLDNYDDIPDSWKGL